MKTKNLNRIILLLVFITIILIFNRFNDGSVFSSLQKEEKTDQEVEITDLGVPIESAYVTKEKLIQKISYIGTIFPKDTIELSTKTPGQIKEISIKEGDVVRKGQILAKIESSNLYAKLESIQAKIETVEFNLQYLKKEEEKYKTLLEAEAISESTYDKISHERSMVEMQLKELYAAKNEVSVTLNDTIITSPKEGVIRVINSGVGDFAVTGKPIIIIDDISKLIIKVNISETDLTRITLGSETILKAPGWPEAIKANVTKVMSNINPKTRIGEIEIGIDFEDNTQVVLGSSVEVDIIFAEVDEALTIPLDAIKTLNDKQVVYKVHENSVEEVEITSGMKIGNKIQIIGGLDENDQVAVKNVDKLYDRVKVYLPRGDY